MKRLILAILMLAWAGSGWATMYCVSQNGVTAKASATAANRPQLVIVYTQLASETGPSISAPGKMRVAHFKGRAK